MTRAKAFKYLQKLLIFLFLGFLLIIILTSLGGLLEKDQPAKIRLGVTFSPKHAVYLNLDWQSVYVGLLDDLKVRNLRIPTYWNFLESEPFQYNWSQTDFMLDEAAKRGAGVILVLGQRQPRWPECYVPDWVNNLKPKERREKLLEFIEQTAKRYKNHPAVWAWQVENEPFLSFGENCEVADKEFLAKEVELVRNLSNKKVILTDSGELGFWALPMRMSDVFGTTLYREVYDNNLGYITYPATPFLYKLKSKALRGLFAPNNQKTIIVELQAEPWLRGGEFTSAQEQARQFSTEDFKNYLTFASKTGFDEIYLWGVEWWYFMDQNGHPEYLNFAKTLFR